MCFVCAIAGAAKRSMPSAAAVAAKADRRIPRLFTCPPESRLARSEGNVSARAAGEQLRLRGHVPGHAHHEQFERRRAGVGELTGLAEADGDRIAATNRRGSRGGSLDAERAVASEYVIRLAETVVRNFRSGGARRDDDMVDVGPRRREHRRSEHAPRQDGFRVWRWRGPEPAST